MVSDVKDSRLRSLTELRIGRNLVQQDIADMVGVRQSSVAYWEIGKTMPRNTQLRKVAKAYGCTVDELLSCFDYQKEHYHNSRRKE